MGVMTTSTTQVLRWIKQGLPEACVSVDGDGRHFSVRIIATEFEGVTLLQRHRLVYRALGEHMAHDIHALSIEALTPEEAESLN